MLYCITCSKELQGRQSKFCSSKCKNSFGNNKHQNYISQQERGISRKKLLVESKGGKCEICSYDKNFAALSFHHEDPNEKDISLSIRECSNNTLEKLLKEVSKCRLLCHNCHMELHYPNYNMI